MIKVVHFQRRPRPGQFSIERVFEQVRRALPVHIQCAVQVSPRYSSGWMGRAQNLYRAARNRGPINHITGDVHYLAAALEGRRTVLTVHDCVSLRRLRGLKRAVFRWMWYEWPMRHVAMVTVVSESVRQELVRQVRCDESKIRVIPNCVGEEFEPVSKRFNEAEPVILQVGTGGTKNLTRTILALKGLPCRLNIIGRLSSERAALLRECGIRYTKLPEATDEELLQAYRECDVVVLASSYEGFGLPIIEANAMGRPVVTSKIWSMPEVAAEAACLVDPFDVGSIRAGVAQVVRDAGYREALIRAGFENVKRFAAKRIAREYAGLYEEMRRLTTD